eukprot:5894796-Ditylum_brightwellii.AAC.1
MGPDDCVAFIFVDAEEYAYFRYADVTLPLEVGSLIHFHGDILHFSVLQHGDRVSYLLPFHVDTDHPIGSNVVVMSKGMKRLKHSVKKGMRRSMMIRYLLEGARVSQDKVVLNAPAVPSFYTYNPSLLPFIDLDSFIPDDAQKAIRCESIDTRTIPSQDVCIYLHQAYGGVVRSQHSSIHVTQADIANSSNIVDHNSKVIASNVP